MLVLHSLVIYAQTVFAGYFMTLREMVYLLEFVQAFVQVWFAGAAAPEQIPLVRFCVCKLICFENGPDELGITAEDLVEQLYALRLLLLAMGIAEGRWDVLEQLMLAYWA